MDLQVGFPLLKMLGDGAEVGRAAPMEFRGTR